MSSSSKLYVNRHLLILIACITALVVIVILVVSYHVRLLDALTDEVAYDTAEGLGYTNVEISERKNIDIGASICGAGDSVYWEVTGTNPSGDVQSFIVCAGINRGGTPRFI